jgi:hypothetical protein
MHFVSQITLPPSDASRVTVTRIFQQPARGAQTGNTETFWLVSVVFFGRRI